jgi:DNA-binding GntR family transcriptional regulator
MKLTPTNLLSRMQAGCAYSATDLAQYFDEPTTVVRDMLCTLVEEGHVGMTSQSSRIIRFRRSQAHTAASPVDLSRAACVKYIG